MARPFRKSAFNGAMLRLARRYKRMTQAELADEMGVHRTTLVRWESGFTEPSTDQIEQLSLITSTPKNWFMGEAAEAISFDDPCWLMDPWLASFGLDELQARTGPALKALGKTTTELARVTFLGKARIDDLLQGRKPTAREIQRLRDTFGEDFNPTPTLGRKLEPLVSGRPKPGGLQPVRAPEEARRGVAIKGMSTATVTPDEQQDLVLKRLLRLEMRLERMEAAQMESLALLRELVGTRQEQAEPVAAAQ